MKKIFLTSVFIILSLVLLAQREVPSKANIAQFLKSTTLVVLDVNPLLGYNSKIREIIEKNWKITPYRFVSYVEYKEKRTSEEYSFLTLDKISFIGDKTEIEYNFLCLSLGGDYKRVSSMPQLCNLPVSYADVDDKNYIFKLSGLVQIIQNHIEFIESQEDINNRNIIEKYNNNAYQLKNKTLYLLKDDVTQDINTKRKLKKEYPYRFKFVTHEDLKHAIKHKKKKVVYLHKVGPKGTEQGVRCYKAIIGADDSKLYYFDYHKVKSPKYPNGLLINDIKKIVNSEPLKG